MSERPQLTEAQKEELIIQICEEFTGMAWNSLTIAEQNIVTILRDKGYLKLDKFKLVTRT